MTTGHLTIVSSRLVNFMRRASASVRWLGLRTGVHLAQVAPVIVARYRSSIRGARLVYVAFADRIAARIAAGELAPGSRLPPERDLADEYGIAYMTVRRWIRELRERGLITTVHGEGTFVVQPSKDEAPGSADD